MTHIDSHAPTANPLKRLASFLAVATTLCMATGAAAEDHGGQCRHMSGGFTSFAVAPPACTSAVGICTNGTLIGDMPSNYYFVMDSLAWGGDPTNPTMFVYTGHSKITDPHGAVMYGQDSGVMLIGADPTVANPFVTTVHVVGGTKKYTHATGTIVATGNLTFATGYADGSYVADVCRHEHEGDDDGDDGHDD